MAQRGARRPAGPAAPLLAALTQLTFLQLEAIVLDPKWITFARRVDTEEREIEDAAANSSSELRGRLRELEIEAFADQNFQNELRELNVHIALRPHAGYELERKIHSKTQKPMLWYHIHKAAGCTMCWLAQINGERIVSPSDQCNWVPYDDRRHTERDFLQHKRATMKYREKYFRESHYTWAQIERPLHEDEISDKFRYGTMLREPMLLAHSAVNFVDALEPWTARESAYSDHLQCVKNVTRNGGDCSHLPGDLWMFFDNYMVRALGGDEVAARPPGGITAADAQRVIDRLGKFDVVAFVEDFTDGTNDRLLRSKLGWKVTQMRMNPSRLRHIRFLREEREFIRSQNEHDYQVYYHFRRLVDKRRLELLRSGTDEEDLPEAEEEGLRSAAGPLAEVPRPFGVLGAACLAVVIAAASGS